MRETMREKRGGRGGVEESSIGGGGRGGEDGGIRKVVEFRCLLPTKNRRKVTRVVQ